MIMNNQIELSDNQKIIWTRSERIDVKALGEIVEKYLLSVEMKRLNMYNKYYESMNPAMLQRYKDKEYRRKTPNHFVPTGYYSTIIDSMAGFMFNNVQYVSDNEQYIESLNEILESNDTEVKDMETGVRALAYNKATELVYTTGDERSVEIKYTSIDPRQMIFVYDENIEPDLIAGIYIRKSNDKDYDYYIDVIYSDLWQFFKMKNNNITQRDNDRQLFFSECPVVEYRTELLNDNSSFNVIIPYIDALDFIMSGNSNEIDRLVDALLVIGKIIKDEDLEHMEEWKTLEGMKTEDRAEYITKDMSPQFREYVSKLLIQEIHKHSHVIDWYSPDSGLTGEVSAKALQTRLFDMDMYSQRLEKIYKRGINKRIRLINELMQKMNMPVDKCEVIFNRTLPNTMADMAQALKDVPFIDDETKRELCGLDNEVIKKRMEDQAEEIDISDINKPVENNRDTNIIEDETV